MHDTSLSFIGEKMYRKISKTTLSMYKPLLIQAPGGLYLEIALKDKIKQSKNGTITF